MSEVTRKEKIVLSATFFAAFLVPPIVYTLFIGMGELANSEIRQGMFDNPLKVVVIGTAFLIAGWYLKKNIFSSTFGQRLEERAYVNKLCRAHFWGTVAFVVIGPNGELLGVVQDPVVYILLWMLVVPILFVVNLPFFIFFRIKLLSVRQGIYPQRNRIATEDVLNFLRFNAYAQWGSVFLLGLGFILPALNSELPALTAGLLARNAVMFGLVVLAVSTIGYVMMNKASGSLEQNFKEFRESTLRAEKASEEARLADERRQDEAREAEALRQKDIEEADKAKRAQMLELADDFEGSVKKLVDGFSVAFEKMSATSDTMSVNADKANSLTSTVSLASETASNSVNSVASASEQLSSSINEISRQANQAAEVASEAVSETERTNAMVTSLDETAAKIGDVVGLINDIAGQTNLLALNATIEAARAGEAGKGFSVVASEVKNLATQTASATDEISEQIKMVQDETGNAVRAIKDISSTIEKINEIAAGISSAVQEQGAATGEISRSILQAAESTQEVANNIVTVSEAASSTGSSATEVKKVTTDLSDDILNLDNEVRQFLDRVRNG